MSVLATRPKTLFGQFIADCDYLGLNARWISQASLRTVDYYRAKSAERKEIAASKTQPNQWLQDQWYESVRKGNPDYLTTYASQEYMPEAWATWICYSRGYVRSLAAPNQSKQLGCSVLEYLDEGLDSKEVGSGADWLDLGCGLGYTTAALKEITGAWVHGTNVPDSPQYAFCELLAERHDFAVWDRVIGPMDVVFASEYFEHFQQPVSHLREVIDAAQPRALLLANTFGPKSVGHFDWYQVDGLLLNGRQTSKAFSAALIDLGYQKVKTGLWNERPQLWVKGSVL